MSEAVPPSWSKERSTPGIPEFYRHESGAWVWLGRRWYANTAAGWSTVIGPFGSREEAMSAALSRKLL